MSDKKEKQMIKKILYIFIFSIFTLYNSTAQTITMSEVDVTNFPRVQTSFMAYKPGGETYSDMNKNDFEVWENGVRIHPDSLKVWCNISPMKVVLVLDKSTSMQDMVDTLRRWDWVVEGAMNFINNMQYTNGSEVALVTFGSNARLLCDFTSDKKRLYDSLKTISPYGKTNYNAAFLGPYDSPIELLKTQPTNFRRIIVFLTDGMHDDDEAGAVKTTEITNALLNANVQCFAITLSDQPSVELNSISKASGGNYYQVTKFKQLSDLYLNIAHDIKDKNMCFLSWPTSMVCDEIERYKNVRIEYLRHGSTIKRVYQVPENGVSRILSDEKTYKFGNPKLGEYKDIEIEIFSENSDAHISNIQINPPTYFQVVDYGFGLGNPPVYPINLVKGQKYKLTIRFTPSGIVTFRKANLIITSSPCNAFFPLVGGIPELEVTNPIEGDVYSKCDSIEIKWSGVDSNTKTDLFYSLNDGQTWTTIARAKTGNSYKWRPGFDFSGIRVKAEVSPAQTYVWAVSGGGKANDLANGIAISKNKDAIYVCGYISDNIVLSDRYVQVIGKTDAFLAKFDLDGNLQWIVNDGTAENDSAFSVIVDDQDFIYYVGTTYYNPIFGKKITPPTFIMLAEYIFIAKYQSNGAIVTANALGANSNYPYFRAWARTVRQNGQFIEVIGYYTGEIRLGTLSLGNTTTPRLFTARYDKNLQLVALFAGGTVTTTTSVKDNDNFTYQIHNYTYFRDFDRFTVKSEGSTDFAITKFGLSSEGFDISDKFTIAQPKITLTNFNINLTPDCYLGDTCNYEYPLLVENNGLVPATITGYEFTGISPYPKYFQLDSSIIGKTLLPGEKTNLTIKINAYLATNMEVSLRLYGNCDENVSVKVRANPVCVTKVKDTIDFGRVFIGTTKKILVDDLVLNLNNIDLPIKPTIQGKNANEFKIVKVNPDTIYKKTKYSAEIQFNPQVYGQRVGRVALNMEVPCGMQNIQLVGFGVYPSATLPDVVDWGIRRTNRNYDTTIFIENPTTSELYLNEIKWNRSPKDKEFSFVNFLQYPLLLPPQSKTELQLTFSPNQEVPYESELLFVIQNKDEINEIPVLLKGQGFLPDLTVEWDCGSPVKVGQTAQSQLILTNNSQNSILSVDRITLVSINGVYNWGSGAKTDKFYIKPQEKQIIPIDFTPIDYSNNLVRIAIWADNYDAQFVDFWKQNSYNFYCQAIGVEYPSKSEFGTNISCESTIQGVTITNTNQSSDLQVLLSQATIIDTDAKYFELIDKNDIVIPGGQKKDIRISFTPDVPKENYNAKLIVPTNIGENIEVNLLGSAELVHIWPKEKSINKLPGESSEIILGLSISKKTNQNLSKLDFKFYYPYNQVRIDEKSITSRLAENQWNWNKIDYSIPGEIHFIGTGNIPTPTNQEIISLKLKFMLDTGKTANLWSKIFYPCNLTSIDDLGEVYTLPVCFDQGRSIVIKLEGNAPILEPILPNPATDEIILKFSCAEKMNVYGEIIDMLGQKVSEIVNRQFDSGIYELTHQIDRLKAGIYFVRFGNENGNQVYKLIINK